MLIINDSYILQISEKINLYNLIICPNTIPRRVAEVIGDDRVLTYENDRLVMK
jgi:hypothetical protein